MAKSMNLEKAPAIEARSLLPVLSPSSCFVYGKKHELGESTGNKERASIAVTDKGFSKTIIKMLEDNK